MSSKNEKKSNVLQFDEKYSRTYLLLHTNYFPPSIFSGLAKRHRRQCGFWLLNAFPMTIWPQHVRNNWEKCTAKKPQKYSGGRRTTLPLDSLTDRRIDIAWFEKKSCYCMSTLPTPHQQLSSSTQFYVSMHAQQVCI